MDIKSKIRTELINHYGEFETILEHQYGDKITEKLSHGSLASKKAWITYNQVILELKHSLKDMLRVKELQYKLTDDGDLNNIVIEAIENVKNFTPELERLYYKIKNF